MSLAAAIASSSESRTSSTGATGPKISSLSSRASSGTSPSTVGAVEVARRRRRARRRRATFAPCADGVVDELGDLVALVVVDQRADLDAVLGAAPDLQRAHALGQPLGELVGDRLVRRGSGWRSCRPRRCCASWRSSRPRRRRRGRRPRRRGTARCRRAPSRRCRTCSADCSMSFVPDLGRAGERQLARARVADQRLHRPRPTTSR